MTEFVPADDRPRQIATRAAAMTVAALILWILSRTFPAGPCWSAFLLVALTAWPIWVFQRESTLFHRRAVLAGITLEGSRARRMLWAGHFSAALQVVVALGWGALLLAFGALQSEWHWIVLGVDALLLGLLVAPVRRMLCDEVRADQVGFVARRWPLYWSNVAILSVALLVLDFFLVGAPDTRGLTWSAVAERRFAEVGADASCRLVGWLVGGLAALDQLAWHARQVLIPSLPTQDLKWAAWGLFLLQAGVLAFAFTRMQLGIVALCARGERPATPGPSTGTSIFAVVALALTVPYLYLTYQLRDFEPSMLAGGARSVVAWANPCRSAPDAIASLRTGLARELDVVRTAAIEDADARIDRELDAIFADVERGIDRYLDWYFSVLGEYQRLGALVVGGFPALMTDKLEQSVGGGSLDGRLQQATASIAQASRQQMSVAAERIGIDLRTSAQASPCQFESLNLAALGDFARDRQRFAIAASGGAVVAAASIALLARKAVTGMVGRYASRTTYRVAATLGGKVAGRNAGSIALSAAGATAICGPGGPLAALCGLGAGIVTWLALDEALIRIDEYRFRAAMRVELLESALEQKAELAKDLRAIHHAAIERMALDVERAVDRIFIPARDGL